MVSYINRVAEHDRIVSNLIILTWVPENSFSYIDKIFERLKRLFRNKSANLYLSHRKEQSMRNKMMGYTSKVNNPDTFKSRIHKRKSGEIYSFFYVFYKFLFPEISIGGRT